MKLYAHPFSPACRNVLVTAAHLGIPLDVRIVDVKAGEHRRPEYLKLNPNALFPTLQDGEFTLWESNAITQYLASRKPANTLFPLDERLRSDIVRWQFWELAHWGPACQPFVWETVFKPLTGMGDPDPVVVQKAEEKFRRFARVLDDHLAGRDWLVGTCLSLADISVASVLMYREPAGFPLGAETNINRWFARIEGLPAWRDTAPQLPARHAA
jgi:glutathione S-transferase